MNSGLLHLQVIVRKDEESEKLGCWMKVGLCLKYQNTKLLRLDCVKKGEKFWILNKIRQTVKDCVFGRSFASGKQLQLSSNQSHWRLLSSLKTNVNIYLDAEPIFFLGQFAQLYSLDVDLGSTSYENYIYPVLFALLPDKTETIVCTAFFVHCGKEFVSILVSTNYERRFWNNGHQYNKQCDSELRYQWV